MYVPPHALARIMGNRPLTANAIENVAVQILQKGAVKDELSLARARPQWFSALTAADRLRFEQERNAVRAALTGIATSRSSRPAPLDADPCPQLLASLVSISAPNR